MPPKAAAASTGNPAPANAQGGEAPVKKKRKASRACQSCQKAHLTCSDTRPCARCIKRGEECIEGEKKKARYLYTPEELENLPKPAPKARQSSNSASNTQRPAPAKRTSDSSRSQAGAADVPAPSQPSASTLPPLLPAPAQAPPATTTNSTNSLGLGLSGDISNDAAPASSPVAPNPSGPPKNITSLGGLGYIWIPPPASSNQQQQQHPLPPPQPQQQHLNMGTNGFGSHAEPPRSTFDALIGQATTQPQQQAQALPPDFYTTTSPRSDSSRRSASLAGQSQGWGANPPFLDAFGAGGPSSSASAINQLGLWPELPPSDSAAALAHSHASSHSPFGAAQLFSDQQHQQQQQHLRASYTSPPSVGGGSQQSFHPPLGADDDGSKGKGRELSATAELLSGEQGPSGRGGHWDQGLEKGLRGFASGSNDAYALATRHGRAYRRLISHVKDKYGEADALKVVKSISEFRPKVLSTTAHHTQDDTLFLEFALHRALRDLTTTLLPITGTPTAIWRRTGEILAVGAEFCILTEWSQHELVFRDTEDLPLSERGGPAGGDGKDGVEGWKGCFCWELMEKQSVIEFYDLFSRCAFDGTTPSFNLLCTLLTPSGRAISCTACFSIRRDMFDFPSLIIGQFLPLLL